MELTEISLTPSMIVLIPVIAALVQVVKKIKYMEQIKDWIPFISIGLALAVMYAVKIPDPIVPAIIVGLTACGAYDAVKTKKPTT